MASLGINAGPNLLPSSFEKNHKSNLIFSPKSLSHIPNSTKKWTQTHLVYSSIAQSNSPLVTNDDSNILNLEKIDYWMQESVPDIVKNLKKAPLLIHIYSEKDNGEIKLRTEKAFPENWPFLQNEWRNDETKSPDGLIFVEELDEENGENEEGVTRAWGICVQGKEGVECGANCCYLLKTNRVCGGIGLGFCTHFCLMRVNNFRDSAFKQFRDSWLLG